VILAGTGADRRASVLAFRRHVTSLIVARVLQALAPRPAWCEPRIIRDLLMIGTAPPR